MVAVEDWFDASLHEVLCEAAAGKELAELYIVVAVACDRFFVPVS